MRHLITLALIALFISTSLQAAEELLAPTTSATQSTSVRLNCDTDDAITDRVTTLQIVGFTDDTGATATALTAGEYANVQFSHNRNSAAGSTHAAKDSAAIWSDLYQDGLQVRLHKLRNAVHVVGCGWYRIDLDDPTNYVGVYAATKDNP